MTKIPSVEETLDEVEKYWDTDRTEATRAIMKYASGQRTALLTELREMIDLHDPNVKMERKTNPAYWGNTLRAELDKLIKST